MTTTEENAVQAIVGIIIGAKCKVTLYVSFALTFSTDYEFWVALVVGEGS